MVITKVTKRILKVFTKAATETLVAKLQKEVNLVLPPRLLHYSIKYHVCLSVIHCGINYHVTLYSVTEVEAIKSPPLSVMSRVDVSENGDHAYEL